MSDTVRSDQTVIAGDQPPEDRFASAWHDDDSPPPAITEYLPQAGDEGYLATLERLVRIEIEQSWRRSSRSGSALPHRLEVYLERFPVLRTPDAIVRLARAEFAARTQFGDRPATESYLSRFPDYFTAESAAELLAAANASPPAGDSAAAATDLGMLGGYKLLQQIGEGGMGVVYRALQPGAGRVVALKVIRTAMTSAGDARRQTAESRFRNEIQAASRLEHENIIPVYDAGSVGELMYFAMRFVDGRSLSDLVKQGPIENRLAAKYMSAAGRGVCEAHRQGILHRDLKPQNVMVEARSGQAMVADFGLAKLLDSEDHLTRTGEAIGTPSYMPPEQIKDAGQVDQRADVYSLGATLYHLLTGRPPFQAPNTLGTMRQVLYDEPVPPRQLNSAVDADLETISLKSLQKEPVRRYQTAEDFVADLDRYLRGEAIHARPIGRFQRLNRWRRRNPAEAALTLTAVVLTLIALTATTIGYRSTTAALDEAEQNLAMAKSAVDELYTEVSEIDLENQPGLQPLKQTLLLKALAYYRRFLERNAHSTIFTADLADSYFRVGSITEEVQSVGEALPHYRKAVDIHRQLLTQSDGDRLVTERLSDSLNALGRAHQRLQQLDSAEAAFDQSRGLRHLLVTLAPGERRYRRKLANVTMNRGLLKVRQRQFEEAAAEYDAAQKIRRDLLDEAYDEAVARDFARGAFNQGTLAREQQHTQIATDRMRDAISWFSRLIEANPQSLSDRFEMAVAFAMLGDLHAHQDQAQSALNSYAASHEQLQRLVRENPKVVIYGERLATLAIGHARLRISLALEALDQQPPDDRSATAHLDAVEEILKNGAAGLIAAIESDPERTGPRHDMAVLCQLQGEVRSLRGDAEGATAAWRRGLRALEPLADRLASNPDCERQWKILQECLKSLGPAEN